VDEKGEVKLTNTGKRVKYMEWDRSWHVNRTMRREELSLQPYLADQESYNKGEGETGMDC